MVSTTVVAGRRFASDLGMNFPVLASRPTLTVVDFLATWQYSFLAMSPGGICLRTRD